MMKQVYCKHYQYIRWLVFGYSPKPHEVCLYNSILRESPIDKRISYDSVADANDYNSDYKCRFYKRKWYKFWVK